MLILDEYQVMQFMMAAKGHRHEALFNLAIKTGMRQGELLGLKWSDVNMDKRFIKVERTKSKKTRFIPINSLLYEELKRCKKEAGKEQRVFPSPHD